MELFNQSISPGANGFIYWLENEPTRANVLLQNTSSVAATFTYEPGGNVLTVPANQNLPIPGISLTHFRLAGNGSTVTVILTWPESPVPQTVTASASITGTVTTSISSSVTLNTDVGQQVNGAIDPRQIRSLGSGDTPSRSWGLNGTDQVTQAWNAGRTNISLIADRITGSTSEALLTMTIVSGSPPSTSSGTTFVVPAGKTLHIQSVTAAILDSSTTAVNGRIRLHSASSGVSTGSPVVLELDLGNFTGTAAAGVGHTQSVSIPDGLEISGNVQLAVSQAVSSASSTVTVCIVGFLY